MTPGRLSYRSSEDTLSVPESVMSSTAHPSEFRERPFGLHGRGERQASTAANDRNMELSTGSQLTNGEAPWCWRRSIRKVGTLHLLCDLKALC